MSLNTDEPNGAIGCFAFTAEGHRFTIREELRPGYRGVCCHGDQHYFPYGTTLYRIFDDGH